jgi:glycerophosphoryl diester phosphodiesterase
MELMTDDTTVNWSHPRRRPSVAAHEEHTNVAHMINKHKIGESKGHTPPPSPSTKRRATETSSYSRDAPAHRRRATLAPPSVQWTHPMDNEEGAATTQSSRASSAASSRVRETNVDFVEPEVSLSEDDQPVHHHDHHNRDHEQIDPSRLDTGQLRIKSARMESIRRHRTHTRWENLTDGIRGIVKLAFRSAFPDHSLFAGRIESHPRSHSCDPTR